MDFVFMLTRQDRTIRDCLDVVELIAPLRLGHVGFKDVGVPADVLSELHERLRAAGATTYLEVVSTSDQDAIASARIGAELGVDYLLGGTQVDEVLTVLEGTSTAYLPFVGRPEGHPTRLGGTPELVAEQCRRAEAAGCAGVDLLAYRAYEAEPLALVAAARSAFEGRLLVAGSIEGRTQVEALDALGVDAFTVGSAAFDGKLAPDVGHLVSQLRSLAE